MKIGILTFHNTPNYGAVLQAYALCTFIRDLGYKDCRIIDYSCKNIKCRELLCKKTGNILGDIVRQLSWKHNERRIIECSEFLSSKGMISKEKYDDSNIEESNDIYDIFICGSDMIWDKTITGNDTTYFLDFVNENQKKYSYGASSGSTKDVEESMRTLKSFQSISVREEELFKWFEKQEIACRWVCDPTMLITKEEWERLCLNVVDKEYVLVYFPNRELLHAAYIYASKKHKKLYVIENLKKSIIPHRTLRIYNPQDWLAYIKGADAIFTNSYHGVLFALYFNKEFYTMNNCIRISSILNRFYLNKHYIINEDDIDYDNIMEYELINSRIESFRNESKEYILEGILKK